VGIWKRKGKAFGVFEMVLGEVYGMVLEGGLWVAFMGEDLVG